MNSYIKTYDGLSLVIDFRPFVVESNHPKYDLIVDAIREKKWNTIPALINTASDVVQWLDKSTSGNQSMFEIDENAGEIRFDGNIVAGQIVEQMIEMRNEKLDIAPLQQFLIKLYNNPSHRAVTELYGWIANSKFTITDDGDFIAYKRVREDYTSCHDGKTKNNIGLIVEMPRNQVDDESDNTCSKGLHFCSHEYLNHFGSSSGTKIVLVKINPADVVSIPTDYNNTKGRACRYEIVGELSDEDCIRVLDQDVLVRSQWSATIWDEIDPEYDIEDDHESASDENTDDTGVYEVHQNMYFIDGYKSGFKDGKGKKKKYKRYCNTAPDGNDSVSVYNRQAYDEGYEHGYVNGKSGKYNLCLTIANPT